VNGVQNPRELTSGYKVEPSQGSNSALYGWISHPDWSCLTIQNSKNHAWPSGPELQIDLWSNQLNLNKVWTLGWFFHPDWSCLTFPKITIQPYGFELLIDLWSQIWTCSRFEPITTRVSFSSWLVLSDHFKKQQFLLFSSFCLFMICFGSSMVVLPRVLRFPPTFVV